MDTRMDPATKPCVSESYGSKWLDRCLKRAREEIDEGYHEIPWTLGETERVLGTLPGRLLSLVALIRSMQHAQCVRGMIGVPESEEEASDWIKGELRALRAVMPIAMAGPETVLQDLIGFVLQEFRVVFGFDPMSLGVRRGKNGEIVVVEIPYSPNTLQEGSLLYILFGREFFGGGENEKGNG